ncbi:Copper amine oxidase N-terminal domain-containing protein [Paenibacillus sp. BC26]|nr:Copper amine oxidase N-terminal domain-containing protein [Paenibacillus sp. BC26]
MSDGTYWVWGDQQSVPTKVQGIKDAVASFGGWLVVSKNGSVSYVERDRYFPSVILTQPVEGLREVVSIHPGWSGWFAVDSIGQVYNLPNKVGRSPAVLAIDEVTLIPGIENVQDIVPYYEIDEENNYISGSIFLKKDGTVWRNTKELESFEPVSSLSNVVDIEHNMILKEDGTVWSLLINSRTSVIATKVEGLINIRSIISNGRTHLAVDDDNQLWFWGETLTGTSDGTMPHTNKTPIRLSGIKNVTNAYLIERYIVAFTDDGNMYDTSTNRESMPSDAKFEHLTSDVVKVQAGSRHLIMQKSDGTLWGWGVNKNAQLGLGDYEFMREKPTPMQPPIEIVLNGNSVALTTGVIIRNGQAFIPLRSVFEQMGAKPEWNAADKKVTIERKSEGKPSVTILVKYTSGEVYLNGTATPSVNKPFIIQNTSYLPLRLISELLGAKVVWVKEQRKIVINS